MRIGLLSMDDPLESASGPIATDSQPPARVRGGSSRAAQRRPLHAWRARPRQRHRLIEPARGRPIHHPLDRLESSTEIFAGMALAADVAGRKRDSV